MAYTYFNQRNYATTPYQHPAHPNATVQTSGCGVCCAAMALANLTDHTMSAPDMAQYSISHGARDDYGTNLYTLLSALKADYPGFDYRVTNNKDELIAHLASGGAAIVNVGGDRGSYKGIFCTTGHFVYVAGLTADKQTIILDPDMYSGKYSGWRAAHVTVDGNSLYCDPLRLDEDCNNKDPRYYLVAGTKATPEIPPETPATTQYNIGDHVTFSTCYTSSTAGAGDVIPATNMATNHGTITRIAADAANPYLLDDGLCWVNDGDIRGYYEATRTGTVVTQTMPLNLRSAPDGAVIGSIPKGAAVQITGESGEWYKVSYDGLNGYASKEYVK